MSQSSIPVDILNPGQVFACMGLIETAEILLGHVEGAFDWAATPGAKFILQAAGSDDPVRAAIAFLKNAEVSWLSPSPCVSERDGGVTEITPGISPKPPRRNAAACDDPDLPALLRAPGTPPVPIGFWADRSSRWAVSFKKSTNGNSSHVRMQHALNAIKTADPKKTSGDPFGWQFTPSGPLFRLDPRGYADADSIGFSPDKLRGVWSVRVAAHPFCELFAAIGLQNARPATCTNLLRYFAWREALPPAIARAALGARIAGLSQRQFAARHCEVATGGDRKILATWEESIHD